MTVRTLVLLLITTPALATNYSYTISEYLCEEKENRTECSQTETYKGSVRFNSEDTIQVFEKNFTLEKSSKGVLSITHYNTPELKTKYALDISIASKKGQRWYYSSGLSSFTQTTYLRQQGLPKMINKSKWVYPVIEMRPTPQ